MPSVKVQKLLPKRLLGKFARFFSRIKNRRTKNMLISLWIRFYPLNMEEALIEDPYSYETLEDLFTRKLKPTARPIDEDVNTICSPCDGTLTQFEIMNTQKKVEAKNHFYTIDKLLATKDHNFQNAMAATIYLAPTDYHRVHMPMAGQITSMTYVPGKLYSVNRKTSEKIPGLLSMNERVVIHAKNDYGTFSIVMVGAMNIGHIHINWHGLAGFDRSSVSKWTYEDNPITLAKGEEIGYFSFGSTVVLLSSAPQVKLRDEVSLDQKILLGQVLGEIPHMR